MKKIIKMLAVMLAVVTITAGCSSTSDDATATADATATPEATETTEVAETTDVIADAVDDYFANLANTSYIIGVDDFLADIDAGTDMTILDIRSADDYAAGHIVGAINAPWPSGIADMIAYIPVSKPLMVYCYSGQTAGQATALFNLLGFDAQSVRYGYNLGLSTTEGIDAYLTTEESTFDQVTGIDFDETILSAVEDYYAGLTDVADTTFKNYKISEDDAKAVLDADDGTAMFLSIRQAEDYAAGHIATAINIPYTSEMSTAAFADLPTDKKIIVYCYSGQTAGQTVAALRMLGYDAVSLNSGIGTDVTDPSGWANKGYELVQ